MAEEYSTDEQAELSAAERKKIKDLEKTRRYEERHPEKVRATRKKSNRLYYEKNRKRLKARHAAYMQEWRKKNREKYKEQWQRSHAKRRASGEEAKQRRRMTLKAHGLTELQYAALFQAQDGLCGLCRRPEKKKDYRTGKPHPLSVDHDHRTGAIRGLLCRSCNQLLGMAEDDVEFLNAAIAYLENGGFEYREIG